MQNAEDPYYNRRVRGTPTRLYRHRLALGILAGCSLLGVTFHFLPPTQRVMKKLQEWMQEKTEAAQARRELMKHSLLHTSEDLKKDMEEDKDFKDN